MNRESYDALLGRYVAWAKSTPQVTGLVAVGSTAAAARQPDEWSDHDLLVVTHPGEAARLRADLSWVPGHASFVVEFAETTHGFVLIDGRGQLVELAIFEPDELAGVVIEDYRVLVDTDGVAALMAELNAATIAATDERAATARRSLALFVKQLVVGINRYSRGEQLSAHDRIRGDAVRHLLALADTTADVFPHPAACTVDPFRRFESRRPAFSGLVLEALTLPLPDGARVLLDLAAVEVEASPLFSGDGGLAAVCRLLGEVVAPV